MQCSHVYTILYTYIHHLFTIKLKLKLIELFEIMLSVHKKCILIDSQRDFNSTTASQTEIITLHCRLNHSLRLPKP